MAIWTASLVDFRRCEFAAWINTTMFDACIFHFFGMNLLHPFTLLLMFFLELYPCLNILQRAKPHIQAKAGLIGATALGCSNILSGVSFCFGASRRNAGIDSIRKTRTIVCTIYFEFINLFITIDYYSSYNPCFQQVPMAV